MSVNDRKKPSNLVKLLVVQAAAMFLMLFPSIGSIGAGGKKWRRLVLRQLVEIRRWKRRQCWCSGTSRASACTVLFSSEGDLNGFLVSPIPDDQGEK